MASSERYWQAKKITLIGAAMNALLGIIKLVGGFWFHSHALVADGFHSISDLLTDAMVLFASKYGSQDADDSHPYGHQRIETAATLLLSLLLILAGIGIAWDACDELIHASHDKPGWIALPIAVFSILANEALFHYTRHVGEKIKSALVIANAWHHRSDAASSIVVVIGLAASLAGYIYFDAIAAVIVGAMIIKMGVDYAWNSVKELVDTAADPKTLEEIENIIKQVKGVKKIHQLRSRFMGHDIFVDVHIQVAPYLSVSEGHYVAQHVHRALINKMQHVEDVTVHVDPEDDEENCPSYHLPNRQELEDKLFTHWKTLFPEIMSWNLHYHDGKLRIDLICQQLTAESLPVYQQIQSELAAYPDIVEIRIYNKVKVITNEQT
ncbi:cation diffusion facilitator family transporter [Legionella dresdenensis]|uniref:Cation diffusion facilitator family transporter n=1 Tax=Legionella dresdenensis TaxID=450200 RepID=A0ABV8CEW9_9GAMM